MAAAGAPTSLARVTFLFAGMIAGVLIGTIALAPDLPARMQVWLGARGPAATAAPQAVAVTPPPVAAPESTAPLAPIVVPPVSLPELGGPAPDQTLVSFLAAERGHRVLVDGRAVPSDQPLRIACGKHRIKIGHKKARTSDFPCGAALTLE